MAQPRVKSRWTVPTLLLAAMLLWWVIHWEDYAVLVHITEGDSNDIVCGAGDGNGVEGYRLLCRRRKGNIESHHCTTEVHIP